VGVIGRSPQSAIIVFLSVELMLNSVNVVFFALSRIWP
jgi:NADH:ubiquinone oxidoreductase subunit K